MAGVNTLNDTLHAYLTAITGLEGLTTNDLLKRLGELDYVLPPRVAGDPVNPPLGATWINIVVGEKREMTAQGVRKSATDPIA